MTHSLNPSDSQLGLLTDLYELTMAAGYFVLGMAGQRATFELFIRRLPECRNYLVNAGVEQVVHYLQHLSFSPEQIDYLRKHSAFVQVPDGWFDHLVNLRFDGDLWAIPEGTIVFQNEPLLRITARIDVAQIVETFLITAITAQTMVASKAARVAAAANGRPVIDFGSRRAHGPQAGLLAARASYIGGCVGTSNAEAGRLLGIPTLGTQAHSWVMAYDSETEAFRKFGEVFPSACTLLVDTYDTLEGVRNAIASGAPMQAVRLDSGDLCALSKEARRILDESGQKQVQIIASGDLNEYKIRDLLAAGAPIDAFGVGTELATSRDEPTLGTVYKLVELETPRGLVGRLKLSMEKKSYPYAKQVFRRLAADGTFEDDVIARATEKLPGDPLLSPVLQGGKLLRPLPALTDIQVQCQQQRKRLPERLSSLQKQPAYPVRISAGLEAEAKRLTRDQRSPEV
jgi:nicotinate phosphoribosyltransferase